MKKKLLIIVLVIIEIGLIMMSFNSSLGNKDINKIEVKEEEIKNNNTLAIMVKGKNETEYKPSDKNTWPTGDYKYAGSLCVGNDGRDIEESEVISFDNTSHTATITTKDTIYCYLYFAEGENAITRIERLSSSSLEPEEDVGAREDVLRRFQGTAEDVQNNYICFGTSITEECTKNTDRYMYRIIGYATADDETTNTKQGQLKLIKKEALEEKMPWHYNHNDNINWFQSDLYKKISTKEYLTNKYYVPSGWENKIADHTWWTGDMLYTPNGASQKGEEIFKIETGKKASEYNVLNMESGNITGHVTHLIFYDDPYYNQDVKYDRVQQLWMVHQSAKVGLMNLSDYDLAYGKELSCSYNKDCTKNWINFTNNDIDSSMSTGPGTNDEHLMIRYGFRIDFGNYNTIFIEYDGSAQCARLSLDTFARPVIYTTENLTLNGSGTITDPYIIL